MERSSLATPRPKPVRQRLAHCPPRWSMGPDRLLRPLDELVHRLDRWSGLRARRQRRAEEAADRIRFAYELGRHVGPVAERCGYTGPQIGGTSVTFCGDPAEVLSRHPWLNEEPVNAQVSTDPGWCVDLHVEWRDGWVELRADPFVHHSLVAPAADRRTLGPALHDVAEQLANALENRAIIVGTSHRDDPRPSDGSWGYLQG